MKKVIGLCLLVMVLVGSVLVVERKKRIDKEGMLDLGSKIVGIYRGVEYEVGDTGLLIEGDIEKLQVDLESLDNQEYNVSEYVDKLREEKEIIAQGSTDAEASEEEREQIELLDSVLNASLVEDVSEGGAMDKRLYEKEGSYYIKVSDMEFEDGVCYIEYEGSTVGVKKEEVPLSYKEMKKILEYDFRLEGYSVGEGEMLLNYKAKKGGNRVIMKLKLEGKKVVGLDIKLREEK